MLPLALSPYFILLTLAFRHVRIAFCLAAMAHPLLLTYSFLTWHFIKPHFSLPTPFGQNVKCSFSQSHSHLFSLSLLLKIVSTAQMSVMDSGDPLPLGPSAWGCALQPVVHPVTGLCFFLRDISKETGHKMAILAFYEHWSINFKQCLFSLQYWC